MTRRILFAFAVGLATFATLGFSESVEAQVSYSVGFTNYPQQSDGYYYNQAYYPRYYNSYPAYYNYPRYAYYRSYNRHYANRYRGNYSNRYTRNYGSRRVYFGNWR